MTDPARLAFIFRTYPESDQGRPGILGVQARSDTQKIRKTDADRNVPDDDEDTECTSFEDEEVVMVADATAN